MKAQGQEESGWEGADEEKEREGEREEMRKREKEGERDEMREREREGEREEMKRNKRWKWEGKEKGENNKDRLSKNTVP